MMRCIAVMQPYLYPYPGYFRLMAAADCFVILDCVQFNRRGRVHRVELPSPTGGTEWLTLPLRRQARDVRIHELEFADDARASLDLRLRRFDWLFENRAANAATIRNQLHAPLASVVGFLEEGLRLVASLLDLHPVIVRSSSLPIAPSLRGQERILAIVRELGGDRYLNAPGGRDLYDAAAFAHAGVELAFLPPYEGAHRFLLPALLGVGAEAVREDVLRTTGIPAP